MTLRNLAEKSRLSTGPPRAILKVHFSRDPNAHDPTSWLPPDGTVPVRGLGAGLLLSALVHAAAALLVAFPRPATGPAAQSGRSVLRLEAPPTVEVPAAPAAIRRPAPPRPGEVAVEGRPGSEPTLDPARSPIASDAPEPPNVRVAAPEERSALAPPDVGPLLEGRETFRRKLERFYPERLRSRGEGGVVELRLFVDARGGVSRVRVVGSSGRPELDRAALRLADELRYLPALNRDRSVGVWVTQRVCFVTVERRGEVTTIEQCERRIAAGGR